MARTRTAKSCGPDAPTLAFKWATMLAHCACDGGKQARSPGRARRKPLKPLRGECRAISGVTVVTTLVCYLHTAHEATGASGARHSLRPLIFRGQKISVKLGRIGSRDREAMSGRLRGGNGSWHLS